MDKTATHNMNAFSIWFKVTSDQRPHVARCQWSFLYNYKSGCSIASFYICQVVSCIWAERRQSMTMSWWRNIQQTMCTVYEANTNVFFSSQKGFDARQFIWDIAWTKWKPQDNNGLWSLLIQKNWNPNTYLIDWRLPKMTNNPFLCSTSIGNSVRITADSNTLRWYNERYMKIQQQQNRKKDAHGKYL